ncbi:MAG: hypothetical protein QXH91_10040, partial [Candidatus Bathyarchaeia archaeon]
KRVSDRDQKPVKKTVASDNQYLHEEVCLNPWNGQCLKKDISLYIIYNGNRFPICRECWMTISSNNIEWVGN